jgi:hypothetical protein
MFFVYLIVGWGCCIYGLALYVLQRMEKPKQSEKTRLSPNFISVGATTAAPAVQQQESNSAPEPPHAS